MPQSLFAHRDPRSWQKISISLPEQHSDPLASFLSELTNTAIEQSTSNLPGYTESFAKVIIYLEEDSLLNDHTEQIEDFIKSLKSQNDFSYTIDTKRVIEEDWNKQWKKHFKPFNLTKRLVVKPSWEEYTPVDNEVVLEMDPGMAFGTGLHTSTRLALQLIEALFNSKQITSVLDVGTGTGILGMSCALFGAKKVIGIDNDIDARVAAAGNIRQNHLKENMSIIDNDISQIIPKFDLVIANITQDVLNLLANDLTARIKPGGSLILSGILTGQQTTDIQHTFKGLGLITHTTKQSEEWTALHLTAP